MLVQMVTLCEGLVDVAETIGSATMVEDRSIILDLCAEGEQGEVGISRLVYTTSDLHYNEVLRHVGPLQPGQSVHVLPWPEVR